MAQPSLDSEKREGLLDALGQSSRGAYEVGDPSEAQEPEAAPAEPEPKPEAAAPEEPAPAAEPAPEPAAESVVETRPEDDDITYLDSLIEEPSVPAPPVMDASRVTQLEQQLTTIKSLLGDRLTESAQRIVASPEATTVEGQPTGDISQVDWSKPELLDRIQESLGMGESEARRFAEGMRVVGSAMKETTQPEMAALREKISALESVTQSQAASRTIEQNLESGIKSAQALGNPMVNAVTNQFVAKLNESLEGGGPTQEAYMAGLQKSVLGRYLLQNKTSAHSSAGVRDAALTVAMASEIRKRSGAQAETVLSGSKEEVTAALGRAHQVDPAKSSGGDEDLSPEDQIRSDIMAAAKAEKERFKATPFG